jgi:hypothetical protein
MKNDINHYYETTTLIDMKDFAKYLLLELANHSMVVNYDNPSIKTCSLPVNYKQIIKEIMYKDNGWGLAFSQLIDINEYYENELSWEEKFSNNLSLIIKESHKPAFYNWNYDTLEFKFEQGEINSALVDLDLNVKSRIEQFACLMLHIYNSRRKSLEVKYARRLENRRNGSI